MSRTLFWYVSRDLLRVFIMTTMVLSGIMSFAGLLRPLMQNGLDASQVGRMLFLFTPAMGTYSMPVAALFATTIVYGRLSADNELTACRASGISYLSIAMPAMFLGLVVAITSLLFLCFIVPVFTLRVEKVIYSNLAQLVANRIERQHQIRIPGREPITVFARSAHVEKDPGPNQNLVSLEAPMIVLYERAARNSNQPLTPREFWMASRADALLEQDPVRQMTSLTVRLTNGMRMPRETKGTLQGGVEATLVGPLPLPSATRENSKFMDIEQLRDLYRFPSHSRRVQAVVNDLVASRQHTLFQFIMFKALGSGQYDFQTESDTPERFTVGPGVGKAEFSGSELVVSSIDGLGPTVQFTQSRGGQTTVTALAKEIHIRTRSDSIHQRFGMTLDLIEAQVRTGEVVTPRATFSRTFMVPMPEQIRWVRARTAGDFLDDPALPAADKARLLRDVTNVLNSVQAEMHARASFSVSCLILVMVGCALGMMFRSGNFLSAFAVSFVPTLLSITLIIAGQQTAEHLPDVLPPDFHNPLHLGLILIWSGNLMVLIIAVTLLGRLQRQ